MASMDADWERVARAVVRRREDLGLSQSDLAHDGGVSIDRVSAIERATSTSYRSATLRAIERGLQWERGSIDVILAGGEPAEAQRRPTRSPRGDDFDSVIARIRQNRERRERLVDLIRAARLDPADDEEDSQRKPEAG